MHNTLSSSLLIFGITGQYDLNENAVTAEKTSFRLLALDGGGVRGLLTARILANIELHLSQDKAAVTPLGLHFDLIAGTSTGGIIALALAAGESAQTILSFYEMYIPKIFATLQKRNPLHSLLRPKYKSDALKSAVEGFFKERTLEDVLADVCITSVALQTGKPRLYKSGYLASNRERLTEKLSDIALSTSAAPTFFKAHSTDHSQNLVDGGICANNPSLIALIDSLQFDGPSKRGTAKPSDCAGIALLSVGTGEQPMMPYKVGSLNDGGIADWNRHLITLLMESQSILAESQTRFLLPPANYLRVNPQLKSPMQLDDVSKLDELKNLSSVTREIELFLKRHFVVPTASNAV
jgi:patatin-like phospholipase/acyl hydrolase